jgi:prepilin-type N-terminal cleavage/methylation domain-containing protein
MKTRALARQGFTLIELMLSMIIAAVVGAALIRMSLAQARFMDQQEAWRSARSVARGGINRLVSDLRAVEATNGVAAAAAGGQDFTIRVPYAFGVICLSTGTVHTVALLPVDSSMYAASGFSGFAVRDKAGNYNYQTAGASLAGAGVPANCLGAFPVLNPLPSLNGSPTGRLIELHSGAIPIPDPGSVVFLFRRIHYEFKNSTALPGRTGLFRTMVDGGATEEIATPFDNTARVNFYVLNNGVPQAAVPALLSDIRGLQLVLNGMSERTPGGSAAPKSANVTTSVFFENRPD